VAFHGDGVPALRLDLGDDLFGAFLARSVVHHHRGARRTEAPGDARTDALRCAGDDGDLALEIAHDCSPAGGRCRVRFDNSIIIELWSGSRSARGGRSRGRKVCEKSLRALSAVTPGPGRAWRRSFEGRSRAGASFEARLWRGLRMRGRRSA